MQLQPERAASAVKVNGDKAALTWQRFGLGGGGGGGSG
jgi:hypothetical protein